MQSSLYDSITVLQSDQGESGGIIEATGSATTPETPRRGGADMGTWTTACCSGDKLRPSFSFLTAGFEAPPGQGRVRG